MSTGNVEETGELALSVRPSFSVPFLVSSFLSRDDGPRIIVRALLPRKCNQPLTQTRGTPRFIRLRLFCGLFSFACN